MDPKAPRLEANRLLTPAVVTWDQHRISWEPLDPMCPITAVPAEESWQLVRGSSRRKEELVFTTSGSNLSSLCAFARRKTLVMVRQHELAYDSVILRNVSARIRDYEPAWISPRILRRHQAF